MAVAGTIAHPDGDSDNNAARFFTRPEARTSNRWIDSGQIAGAEWYEVIAAEHVLNIGPLQFCAEAQNVFLQREGGSDLNFWGAYGYVAYMLTGEHVPWEREDGLIETDYDPHIALAFADFNEEAPPPDLTPFFPALAQKPMLSVRGAISDLFGADVVDAMRAVKPDLETVTVENVGHAPMLDEPEAWDALLSFLAKVE